MTLLEFQSYLPALEKYTKYEAKAKDGTKTKIRWSLYTNDREEIVGVFIYLKGSKRYGRPVDFATFLEKAEPIIKGITEKETEWHKRCKKCETKLIKSGLWPELRELYHNLQKISYEDWTLIKRGINVPQLAVKYPFIMDKNGNLIRDYADTLSFAKTKSMYFGYANETVKKEIATALKNKTKYTTSHRVNYDVSFSYTPENSKAIYSEEYRNCGNGHYYLALDETTAVFYEDD